MQQTQSYNEGAAFYPFGISRSLTKNEIRDEFLRLADEQGRLLSRSRANNMADRYKRGRIIHDSIHNELVDLCHHSDPTGERAVHHLLCTAEECDRCGRQAKKNGPETHSAKNRLEAVQATTY
ncbi:hypothetical protein [Galactobacter valiniphilus]|uniref:hypothetical protein n=1 Tax=Galactobacter valiniphilus TaxID=2676122 RepID=UPI00373609CA